MSGSQQNTFRPAASPTRQAALPGRPTPNPAPLRPYDRIAPQQNTAPTPPPRGDSGAMQVARALSDMNPRLGALMDTYMAQQRVEEAGEADSAATMAALQSNISSWADAVKATPDLADRSPYFRRIYEDRLARMAVQRRGNELTAEYWNSPLAGSEDPAAINGWLNERMVETLKGFSENPNQRAAAAEEIRTQAQQLIRGHQANAVRNLVSRNEDSFSSAVGAVFDTAGQRSIPATPGIGALAPTELRSHYEAASAETGIPVNVLMAQGHHESGGFAADVLNGTRRGTRGEIGLAQVLPSTAADPGYGLAPISEADLLDPGKAILFQARYLKARAEAAGVKDWSNPNEAVRGLASYNGQGPASLGYGREVLGKAGGVGGVAGSNLDLASSLERLEAEARAQGVDGRRINSILAHATAEAMVRQGREDFAELGFRKRPDGTPGFATTAEGRQIIDRARERILSRRVQEENRQWTQEQRAKATRTEDVSKLVGDALIGQLAQGQAPMLTPEVLSKVNEVGGADAVKAVMTLNEALQKPAEQSRAGVLAQLELQATQGKLDEQDLLPLLGNRMVSLGDFQRVATMVRDVRADPMLSDGTVQTAIAQAQDIVGDPDKMASRTPFFRQPEAANAIRSALMESLIAFRKEKPTSSRGEVIEHIHREVERLVPVYAPGKDLASWRLAQVQAKGVLPDGRRIAQPGDGSSNPPPSSPPPATETPKGPAEGSSGKPGTVTTGDVMPAPGVDWRTTPVFASRARLAEAFREWRENPTGTGPYARWLLEAKGSDALTFYRAQQRLLR
ncbi:transglycosylase SLT domain-containing protein [Roseomonas gilardii subsp. gilardii]|uniref:transglycosylase SLT domain-containing protein n=1 Tax=Roseomonas gilardii TaxID=257708 RepID=UPI001FFBDD4D|nr:transglycosylase SLT domain-containing protein [Roseomonas gilardii]UPG71625.1 transglycosylase SLT domain-containing protein [Roseomonas gilardii subsp. gilardii]